MKVADLAQGKDNNFNLIRIIAAYAVLVQHAFPLALGPKTAVPLEVSLGVPIGVIAVDVFFMTSGFLVTASLLARKSTVEFVWARVLRIFPALFVMLMLTVFGLGLFFTTLSPSSYLLNYWTRNYFINGLTLLFGVSYELPGVFEGNPYAKAVNGSLWTMPYELRMYVTLAVAWAALSLAPRVRSAVFPVLVVVAAFASGVGVVAARFGLLAESHWMGFFFMFFSGAAFYVLRARIPLSSRLFVGCLCVLAAAAAMGHTVFFVVYKLSLAYVLFFVAYVPAGWIRHYNRFGDYSYGVYIYSFPVQQSVAALLPGISVLSMVLLSSAFTFVLAGLSWHLIEKRVMGLKGHCVEGTHRLLPGWLLRTPR